jgi:2-keto-4-pentenoate hydratase
MWRLLFASCLVALLLPAQAFSARLSDEQLTPLVSTWKSDALVAFVAPSELTMRDAYCSQDRLIALLEPTFGRAVGWKVAATSTAVQAAVRGGPTWGVLLDKMIEPERSDPIRLAAGLRNFEADLILQVRDDGINDARSPLEILEHLSNFVPLIELPNASNVVLAPGYTMSPALLAVLNSAGRQGVVGKAVPLKPSWEWVIALVR